MDTALNQEINAIIDGMRRWTPQNVPVQVYEGWNANGSEKLAEINLMDFIGKGLRSSKKDKSERVYLQNSIVMTTHSERWKLPLSLSKTYGRANTR